MKMQPMSTADVETFFAVKDRMARGVPGFRECTRDEFQAIMRVAWFYMQAFENMAEAAIADHHRIKEGMEI